MNAADAYADHPAYQRGHDTATAATAAALAGKDRPRCRGGCHRVVFDFAGYCDDTECTRARNASS